MQPGEARDVQPKTFKAAGGEQNTPPKMDEVIQWKRHPRHVGVDGEFGDAQLIFLRILRLPSHRINGSSRRHQTGQ